MGSVTRDRWLSVGYMVVVAVLNASLIVVLSFGLKQNPKLKNYHSNDFHIAGIILNSLSLGIHSLKIILQLIKLWKKMEKSNHKLCVGKTVACMEIILFLLVYIGNIVMLVFCVVFLVNIKEGQDNTLLIISCTLFAILCLIQSVLLLIMLVYPLEKGLL